MDCFNDFWGPEGGTIDNSSHPLNTLVSTTLVLENYQLLIPIKFGESKFYYLSDMVSIILDSLYISNGEITVRNLPEFREVEHFIYFMLFQKIFQQLQDS